MRVAFFPPGPHQQNSYLGMVADGVSGASVSAIVEERFDWLSPPDVLHIHWPEALFIDSRWANPARAALRVLRLKLRILLTRAFGGAIVWTVHNRAPHEPPREHQRYARFMDWFQRRVTLAIAMDDAQLPDLASRFPSIRQWRTIPHPAYNLPEPVPLSPEFAVEGARRLAVMFGKMRHYKGAPQAMTAFVEAASGGDRLIVAGRARDRDMSQRLAAIASASGGTAVYVDRAITDRELAALLSAADVAVFNFSAILNSGSLIAAVSTGCRCLAPRTPTFTSIAEQVGPGWIDLFDPPLTGEHIAQALARRRPTDAPRLHHFDNARVGMLHRLAYEEALHSPTR